METIRSRTIVWVFMRRRRHSWNRRSRSAARLGLANPDTVRSMSARCLACGSSKPLRRFTRGHRRSAPHAWLEHPDRLAAEQDLMVDGA